MQLSTDMDSVESLFVLFFKASVRKTFLPHWKQLPFVPNIWIFSFLPNSSLGSHATSIATTGTDTITRVHQTRKQSKHKEELETMHGDNSRYLSCLLEVDLDFASGNIRTLGKTKLTVSLGTIHQGGRTCVSISFFSKTLDPLVAKNGNTQVYNTNFGFLIVKLTRVLLPWQH